MSLQVGIPAIRSLFQREFSARVDVQNQNPRLDKTGKLVTESLRQQEFVLPHGSTVTIPLQKRANITYPLPDGFCISWSESFAKDKKMQEKETVMSINYDTMLSLFRTHDPMKGTIRLTVAESRIPQIHQQSSVEKKEEKRISRNVNKVQQKAFQEFIVPLGVTLNIPLPEGTCLNIPLRPGTRIIPFAHKKIEIFEFSSDLLNLAFAFLSIFDRDAILFMVRVTLYKLNAKSKAANQEATPLASHLQEMTAYHLSKATQLTHNTLVKYQSLLGKEQIFPLATHLQKLDLANTPVEDAWQSKWGLLPSQQNPLTHLSHLDLSHTHLTDRGLEQIKSLPFLRSLVLNGCSQVTDQGLEAFCHENSKLTSVSLAYCSQITNAGMHALCLLSQLSEINLQNIPIDDDGLSHFDRIQNLRRIVLSNNDHITNGSISFLKTHRNLVYLNLSGCKLITGVSLKIIREQFPLLSELELDGCVKITDLTHLKGAAHLTRLNIARCPITDKTLQFIAAHLKQVKYLDITGCTQISSSAITALSQSEQLTVILHREGDGAVPSAPSISSYHFGDTIQLVPSRLEPPSSLQGAPSPQREGEEPGEQLPPTTSDETNS